MPSIILSPFPDLRTTASETTAAVSAGSWIINGERDLDETRELKAWDYGTALALSREIVLDGPSVLEATGIGDGAVLCVTALWSGGGTFEAWDVGTGARLTISGPQPRSIFLSFRVPSEQLAGVLKLATHVVLEKQGKSPRSGSASDLGSVLWEDEASLQLEGTAARLSVTSEDFRARFGEREASAAWTVSLAQGWLHAHPSVGLQVIFNTLNQTVLDSVRSHRPGPREKVIRATVAFDVGRQMIIRALLDDEFGDDTEFDRQTSGAAVKTQLRTIFPGLSVDKVRAMYRDESDRFERILQAHHKLFGGVA